MSTHQLGHNKWIRGVHIAYLHISQSPIDGMEQKAATFWKNILDASTAWLSRLPRTTTGPFREFAITGSILRKSQKFMDGISCTSDASSCGNGATTEEMNRPEGRKKAKLASAADTEESSILKQLDHDNKMRNDAFLAETKRKNDLIEEQMTIDSDRTNIESDESKAFFSFMRKKKRLGAILSGPNIPVFSNNSGDERYPGGDSVDKERRCESQHRPEAHVAKDRQDEGVMSRDVEGLE
ncbi:hypothetical protein F442_22814 [Phytophthora nicotianae P10297]|uniref:No apical meristem-associated C-terminal domain-containing protein n=1 Tax=Phytophthora nicotianae P10297 TaxID=1317064 RepID=W2XYH1_PHYNI|nr:hypothetical protein F442_22814 [Phytophthora nicotianae P10297]